ncbi:MAG: histidine--tRNA ligase, partial [Chitinophagaceae bacterium]
LKYDLTIQFARYVAMNQGQLTFPFKRYQIQPVWRADRPQRGRYREFYQCDADVVGSNSLINEVELVHIYYEAFNRLGLSDYDLRMNSRKLLTALAEKSGGIDRMMDITIAIDKLDKIGLEEVKNELQQKNLSVEQVSIVEKYLNIQGSTSEKLGQLTAFFSDSETGKEGIEEINFVLSAVTSFTPTANLSLDVTLARGLNYYTGIIFEAKAPSQVKIGSIGGGGRYDDLTGLFGVPNIPGVGISFGVDRIYDVLEELILFPEKVSGGTEVLFFNLGEAESKKAYSIMQDLRSTGIAAEIFHEEAKMDKQFKYAEKRNISYVVIIGSNELSLGMATIKNIKTGEQNKIAFDQIDNFKKFLTKQN